MRSHGFYNTKLLISVSLLAISIPLLSGCGSERESNTTSTNIPITNIAPDFRFFATGTGVTAVEALLQKDSDRSNIYVDLVDGDYLWATTGNDIDAVYFRENLFQNLANTAPNYVLLDKTNDNNIFVSAKVWYRGQLNDDNLETVFRMQLLRKGKPQASSSTVSLPPNFSISAPLSNDTFSRSSDAIVVNWSPSGVTGSVIVKFETSCALSDYKNKVEMELTGDPGTYTLPANSLAHRIENNCSTTVFVIKSRLGTLDPSFTVGGRIIAYQTRTVTFSTRN